MADGLTLIKDRIVGFGRKAADQFAAHPLNWRKHPQRQRAAVEASLRELGWIGVVIENVQTGNLIDGHERVWQALRAGGDVPYIQVDLTPEEEALALATFDAITNMAETDAAKLDELLRDVSTGEAALMELMAETAKDAGLFLEQPDEADAEPQIDRADELRQKWGVETGQLWRLPSRTPGQEHRLICGDCTDAAVVERVMGGGIDCTVTDPPYGVGVDYSDFDDTTENTRALIDKFMPMIPTPAALTPGVPAMWNYPRPAWVGAWVHPAPTSSGPWGFVGANPILYYGQDPYLKAGKGRRDCSLVAVADRRGKDDHPVAKPLNVWSWLIERMTPNTIATVYDPFLGSGTTLIACENLARQCRAVEISPGYVAVALQRYQDAFGITAELVE